MLRSGAQDRPAFSDQDMQLFLGPLVCKSLVQFQPIEMAAKPAWTKRSATLRLIEHRLLNACYRGL